MVVKEAVGEFDAGGGDGDVVGADGGAVADLFGDGEALLEEALQYAADGARFFAEVVGLFELAEDLRFAEDERVQPAGDAIDVADGVAVAVVKGEAFEDVRRGVFGRREPLGKAGGVAADGVDFAAVAGGEQRDFARAAGFAAGGEGGQGFFRGEGEFFALRGVGGVVVEAVGGDGFAGRVGGVQHMVIKSFM